MIFIILGSIPFIAYIKFLNGDRKIFVTDSQVLGFFKVIIFSIFILILYLLITSSFQNGSFRSISFNVISILTGTGYVTKDFDQWGNFSLIFFLMN